MTIDFYPLGGFAGNVAEAAARTDDAGSLRRLLAATKPGEVSGFLRPALATAVAHSSTDAVQVLVEVLGVDAYVDLDSGWTALHAAAFLNNEVVAEILVSKGADIGLKSATGQTPKEVASTFGNAEVLYVLENPAKATNLSEMQEEEVATVGVQCGPEGLAEFAAQTDPPPPPPAQAEFAAQCGPEGVVHASMQVSLPFPGVDGSAQTVEPYPQPPPPAPVQADAAVQHDRCLESMSDAAVQFQPEPGMSCSTQTAAPPVCSDTASQYEEAMRMTRSSQTQAQKLSDMAAQCTPDAGVDSAAQTIAPRLVESAAQSEQTSGAETAVQCGAPWAALTDRATQDAVVMLDSSAQHDAGPAMVDRSAQHDPAPQLVECATQMSTPPLTPQQQPLPPTQHLPTDPSLLPGLWARLSSQEAALPASSLSAASSSSALWQQPDPSERRDSHRSDASQRPSERQSDAERSALRARALARAERRQHCNVYAEAPLEQHDADLKVTGLGRHLKWVFDDDGAMISNFKDGAVGNLQVGDRLVAINDHEVDGMSKHDILKAWKSEHGASEFTTLFFKRGSADPS